MRTFAQRIEAMNITYKQPVLLQPGTPDNQPAQWVGNFRRILADEVQEGMDVAMAFRTESTVDALVELADWLGDIIVYCRSEAMKFGIPMEEVLDIIMDSNESKLDPDGQPILDPTGQKFMKGPNYWKPEPKIKALLLRKLYPKGEV